MRLLRIFSIIFLFIVLSIEIYFIILLFPRNVNRISSDFHCWYRATKKVILAPIKKEIVIVKNIEPVKEVIVVVEQPKPIKKITIIAKNKIPIKKSVIISKKQKTRIIVKIKPKTHKKFVAKRKIMTHRRIVSTPIIKNTIQSELAFKTAYLEKEKDYPVKTAQNAVVSQLDTKPIRLEKPRFTGLPPTPTFIAPPTIAIIPQKPIEKWMPKDPAYRKSAFYNRELRRN